ncbi:major facilitator superfamily domain-containing protein [Syncephalis plumigaleata]|nr:major facilitator superfamily domain-containing protein [Syncephalis plumigaleata]
MRHSTSTSMTTTTAMNVATPIPRMQLFVICCARFGEPVAFTVLFPFVYFIVQGFHISDDPKETGYYVGILASAFSIAQCISGVPWGWLSDRIGRRPVVLMGLLATTICTVAFGFSPSYRWALISRILAGLCNGNVAVLKSMLAEISDKTNQGKIIDYNTNHSNSNNSNNK